MIKTLMVYIISFMVLFLGVHFFQDFILNYFDITVRYSLWDINLFFAVSSLVICFHLKVFSLKKSLQPQLGFIYLPTLFVKGIFFYILFQSKVFDLETLSTVERLNLLIPLFLFLGLEVYFVVKTISKNET
ncbi:hypothetical protein HNV10_02700 [Winogradskyella litoriviva]|uniref:Uncharacterized protein n=1 Tax=Winogradskyella litoriviva TaxID=1220182 RepID=A0ABX2E255_9FLAO|nr:DUF6168 family protein [Winogradskyella litoriviva]NRD22133.1 hypothetical protein [Winogradskyella litoriviva]